MRIGELSQRTGISPDLLRAWERRYRLLEPQRSEGGFRLYGDDDLRRVLRMQALIDSGLSAAEAAREARSSAPAADGADLLAALLDFDESAAHTALDSRLAAYSLDTVLRETVMPALRAVGARWAAGEASIAQEHFASNLVAGRLHGLARGWDRGAGPRAVLALPPGERHELGLLAFGLMLRAHGWRITYLGADTPVPTLAEIAATLRPELVVVSAVDRERLEAVAPALRALASGGRLALGGPGADETLAKGLGARLLPADVVAAAELVAAG